MQRIAINPAPADAGVRGDSVAAIIREDTIMNTSKGVRLVNDFTKSLNAIEDVSVNDTHISRNVFEFKGHANCLLYIKGRSEQPYRWGVTANVIDRLQAQPQKWFVILLFSSHETGYLLNSQDVKYYIQSVWPRGRDGDYKPATGSYLFRNSALHTIKDFMEIINTV